MPPSVPTLPAPQKIHSRLKHNLPLSLGSEYSTRLFHRYFERMDDAFYMSTKVLRFQRRDDEANVNDRLLDEMLKQFQNDVENTLSSLTHTYSADKTLSSESFAYDHTTEFQAACSTHISVRLLNIYEKLDHLLALCDALEIIGLLSPDSAHKLMQSWVRRFRQFCTQVNEVKRNCFPARQPSKHTVTP